MKRRNRGGSGGSGAKKRKTEAQTKFDDKRPDSSAKSKVPYLRSRSPVFSARSQSVPIVAKHSEGPFRTSRSPFRRRNRRERDELRAPEAPHLRSPIRRRISDRRRSRSPVHHRDRRERERSRAPEVSQRRSRSPIRRRISERRRSRSPVRDRDRRERDESRAPEAPHRRSSVHRRISDRRRSRSPVRHRDRRGRERSRAPEVSQRRSRSPIRRRISERRRSRSPVRDRDRRERDESRAPEAPHRRSSVHRRISDRRRSRSPVRHRDRRERDESRAPEASHRRSSVHRRISDRRRSRSPVRHRDRRERDESRTPEAPHRRSSVHRRISDRRRSRSPIHYHDRRERSRAPEVSHRRSPVHHRDRGGRDESREPEAPHRRSQPRRRRSRSPVRTRVIERERREVSEPINLRDIQDQIQTIWIPRREDRRLNARGSSEPPQRTGPRPTIEQPDFNPEDFITLSKTSVKKWRKGPVVQTSHKVSMKKPLPPAGPLERQLQVLGLLEHAFNKLLAKAPTRSKVQAVVKNKAFHNGSVATCVHKALDLTFHHLSDRIAAVLQSDESVSLEKSTFMLTSYTVGAFGSRNTPRRIQNRLIPDQSLFLRRSKHSTYDPIASPKLGKKRQGLCVPLILARELYAMETGPQGTGRHLRHYLESKASLVKAQEIVKQLGLEPKEGPFTIDQLPEFAKALPDDCSLRFFDNASTPIINVEKPGTRSVNIALAYTGEDSTYHAHAIRSLKGFFAAKKLCEGCWKEDHSRKKQGHRCHTARCLLCKHLNCENRLPLTTTKQMRLCPTCEVFFSTQQCMEAHICEDTSRCPRCKLPIKYKKSHKCDTKECQACRAVHGPLERCYVQPDKPIKERKRRSIWYADAESQIDSEGQHKANVVFLQRRDGRAHKIYTGPDAMLEFTKDCIQANGPFKNSYIVWHNASGYDAHLWWRELIKLQTPPRHIIRRGQRILTMELSQNSIICRDSLQFIPATPLASFPRMFGLDTGPKGEFPHGLNTPKWIQFRPSMKTVYREVVDGVEHRFPRLEYFWPDQRKPEDLEKLKAWHKEQVQRFQEDKSLVYYPEQELVKYCGVDVRILRCGFEQYRETWLEQFPDLEPLDSVTFSSYNNTVLRTKYIPKNSIAVIPAQGYQTKQRKVSIKAMAWLAWVERKEGLTEMRNGRRGGEVKLTRHHVDGVAKDKDGVIQALNFHGCWFHGHELEKCSKKKRKSYDEEEMHVKRLRTELTDRDLEELERSQLYGPLKYRVMRECTFDRERAEDPELEAFYQDYKKRYKAAGDALRPRDALRGGRTNTIKYNIGAIPEGYVLYYLDFTSLYPGVNASVNGEVWPLGHPDIYVGKEMDDAPNGWFGLAKVEIIPPRGLQHPVLGQPFKNGRVIYHLCTACAEEGVGGECEHSDSERTIKGTFFTGELDVALEQGYKLSKVHELWHWPEERRTKTLFRPMICDQFKKKVVASSKPADPSGLLADLALLGITIDENEWNVNEALRALAKFSLNNIWGFLGARTNYEQTEVVNSLSRLEELEADEDIELTHIELTEDEETLFVVYRQKHEPLGHKHSVVLASLTTAYARMALYKVLQEYPDEVVYMDTDSVFLYLPTDRKCPPTSTKLGGLKDEILEEFGDGAKITSFGSIGPKCYAYKVEKDGVLLKEVVKIKGVKLAGKAASEISADHLLEMAEDTESAVTVPQDLIKRDLFKLSLKSVKLNKRIRFYCSKRYLKPEPNPLLDTLPFGF